MEFQSYIEQGVTYLTEKKEPFSKAYITVRQKEGRILNDKELNLLPNTPNTNPNHHEWQLRKQSTHRFLNYVESKKTNFIMDIGCGNGWFTNHIASTVDAEVHGIDINPNELEQAARVFQRKNLTFFYADIFKAKTQFSQKYDLITLNACVQYFKDILQLLDLLKTFLTINGEIHIIDSPFYDAPQNQAAKKRTQEYYQQIGVPEMTNYYFHHSNDILKEATVLYSPKKGIFNRVFSSKDSPFHWVKFSND